MKPRPHPTSSPRHPPSRRRRAGFTLIEAALTTVIVGTGVLAIVAAQQAYHQKNGWAQRTGTAMLLANEVRELTWAMPATDPQGGGVIGAEEANVTLFDDLDDFAGIKGGDGTWSGVTFSAADETGPINALRRVIPDMKGWSQHVTIEKVSVRNLATTFTYPLNTELANGLPPATRVTVTVNHQGVHDEKPTAITTLTWVVPEQ